MSAACPKIRPEFHRFPRRLVDERYEISHEPACDEPFSITLFDKVSRRYQGSGLTIGAAAKAALKKRERP